MTGFQRVVNREPAVAVAGDFASNNPRTSVIPPVEAGFVCAAAEVVTVGFFAWGGSNGQVYGNIANVPAGGSAVGFVARQSNKPSVQITAYLGETKMTINAGQPVTLQNGGEYWANIQGGAIGDGVFALNATGAPSLVDDATTAPTGFVLASVAPVDAVTNGATTIAVVTGIMTIAVLASGVVEVGQRVTGVGVPDGTFITKQLTGAAGAAGTYQTNSVNRAAVAAFTATMVQGGLAKISKVAV